MLKIKSYKDVINVLVSGLFFLIPIGIILIILEKLFSWIWKIFNILNFGDNGTTLLHGAINDLIIVVTILLICFLGGLFSRHKWGKHIIAVIEHKFLINIPGYHYIKATAEGAFGVPVHYFSEVVLLKTGDVYQMGFKIGPIDDNMLMIYIPNVPRHASGRMFIVHKYQVITTNLTVHQAMVLLRNMGYGESSILSKYFNEAPL